MMLSRPLVKYWVNDCAKLAEHALCCFKECWFVCFAQELLLDDGWIHSKMLDPFVGLCIDLLKIPRFWFKRLLRLFCWNFVIVAMIQVTSMLFRASLQTPETVKHLSLYLNFFPTCHSKTNDTSRIQSLMPLAYQWFTAEGIDSSQFGWLSLEVTDAMIFKNLEFIANAWLEIIWIINSTLKTPFSARRALLLEEKSDQFLILFLLFVINGLRFGTLLNLWLWLKLKLSNIPEVRHKLTNLLRNQYILDLRMVLFSLTNVLIFLNSSGRLECVDSSSPHVPNDAIGES